MDEVEETSKETRGIRQMIGTHNFVTHGWTEGKLYMEEIVFDFLCLEDDIVEDLCKDFPAQNNYQRYTVAHSYDFDRRKFSSVQSSQDGGFTGTGISCPKPATVCESTFDINSSMPLNCIEKDYGRIRKSTQGMLANPNKDGEQGPSESELRGNHDPIVLSYELLSLEESENKGQKNSMNEKMKIKIELLKDLFGEGGSRRVGHFKEVVDGQPRTTKIKLRIPKSVITAEESSLRDFVLDHIKERCDFTESMQNDTEVSPTNGQEHSS